MIQISDWIAIWGAVISTLLATKEIFQWWHDRDRFDASLTTSSNVDAGHNLKITNLSSKTILISHWELFLSFDRKGKKGYQCIVFEDFDSHDISMDPRTSKQLHFSEGDYFSISEKSLQGRSIYLKLWIAGRSPWVKKLYPFD